MAGYFSSLKWCIVDEARRIVLSLDDTREEAKTRLRAMFPGVPLEKVPGAFRIRYIRCDFEDVPQPSAANDSPRQRPLFVVSTLRQ